MDPPVSVPRLIGASPAATATAEPDDDPDGEQAMFQGLRAGGNSTSQDGPPWANSHVAVFPSRIAPAASSRSVQALSSAGTLFASKRDCAVVGTPATSKMSFRQYGTPCNGLRGPEAAISASASCTLRRARSAVTVTKLASRLSSA